MADSDSALYVLRYNQVSGAIEAQGGTPSWNTLTLSNPSSGGGSLPLTGGTLTGALVITPTVNSTAVLAVNKSGGSTRVFTVDSTNAQVSVGTAQTAADFGVTRATGAGESVTSFTRNLSSTGNATSSTLNDGNQGLSIIAIGSAFSSASIRNKSIISSSYAGLRLDSSGAGQVIDFTFGGGADANVKVAINSSGVFTTYAGQPTVGVGLTPLVAKIALTAQAADIPSTTLYAVSDAGLYEVNMYFVTTAQDAGASTAIDVVLGWTDDSTTVQSTILGSPTLVTVGAYTNYSYPIAAASGTNITYSTANGGTFGAARYSLYMTVTRLH